MLVMIFFKEVSREELLDLGVSTVNQSWYKYGSVGFFIEADAQILLDNELAAKSLGLSAEV